jgi:hypothetical protein
VKPKPWQFIAASVVLEMAAGAAMLAYYRARAIATSEKNWGEALKPEPTEGEKKDGVPDDS